MRVKISCLIFERLVKIKFIIGDKKESFEKENHELFEQHEKQKTSMKMSLIWL